jgi:hypothetical protein
MHRTSSAAFVTGPLERLLRALETASQLAKMPPRNCGHFDLGGKGPVGALWWLRIDAAD